MAVSAASGLMPRKRIAVSCAQASDQRRNRSWRCRASSSSPWPGASLIKQARFVQPAEEGPEFGLGNRPRRKLAGKLARHLGEAHRPAEHFQQRMFFRREMKVLERERILHDPRRRAGHLDRHGDQVGPQPEGERAIVGGDGFGVMGRRYLPITIRTGWPGRRRPSRLSISAQTRTWPVIGSTSGLTNDDLAVERGGMLARQIEREPHGRAEQFGIGRGWPAGSLRP